MVTNSIFDIVNDSPVITPQALFIPEFKKIWDRDKSPEKQKAQAELAYIYHMVSPHSVYRETGINRTSAVRQDYGFSQDWKPDKAITDAVDKFRILTSTPELRALESAIILSDKLAAYFRNLDFDDIDDKGALVNDPRKAMQNLKDLGGVVQSIVKLREEVEKSLAKKQGEIYGDKELNMFDAENQ